MTNDPLFTISVVNWNAGEHLEQCLKSVLAQPPELYELIVFDNGSTDGSRAKARALLDEVRLYGHPHRVEFIGSFENVGFAAAQNRSLSHASGRWFVMLNPDARLAPDFLEVVGGGIRRAPPEVGMFAVKLYREGGGNVIDNVGLTFCADGQNRGLGHGEPDRGQYESRRQVFCPSGAAGIYRREALAATGGLDEDYFAYGEDFELGLRLRRAGEQCALLSDAIAWHHGSTSLGEASPRRLTLIERNRIWTTLKHFPLGHLARVPVASIERYRAHWRLAGERRGVAGTFLESHGAAEMARATLRGQGQALAGAPRMLLKRASLSISHPLGEKQFAAWLGEFGLSPTELAEGI